MDPRSSGQHQKGESEGDMTAGKSGHCHRVTIYEGHACWTLCFVLRVMGQSNGKWSEESR